MIRLASSQQQWEIGNSSLTNILTKGFVLAGGGGEVEHGDGEIGAKLLTRLEQFAKWGRAIYDAS